MKRLGLHEIRKEYLEFFREKEHLVAPSYSLIPKDDDSLLLIGAGMAPLKKYFTGEEKAPHSRMTTCQKCIRTGDIENVGKTDRHATFFEMLGNFSFGDYFKLEAMTWAWEFLNERLEIAAEDLWVTVYEEDDEAHDLWRDEVGLPEDRIVRLGKEDNFWELEVGPSGPCSEIFVDRGAEYGCGDPNCKPGCECDRFIEVWNLVFTQFDKDEEGNYNPLAHPNIDTGMGLERMATVLEGANNIFEIEAIQDIIHKISEISNYEYGTDSNKDESIRVITDHCRAMTFLVSDGVLPSNEGRGYVLRRLIRRAARHGKLLGIEGQFLTIIVEDIIDSWKVEYDELDKNRNEIKKIIQVEEGRFQETIDAGIDRLDGYVKEMESDGVKELSGEKAFMLYDTYGFPVDLTREILEEKGLTIDEDGFHDKMEEQRNRAREARKDTVANVGWGGKANIELFEGLDSEFKGYNEIELDTKVISLIKENEKVDALEEGEEGIVVLKETPFYGESGGQIGDKGILEGKDFTVEVLDTKHAENKLIIHIVKVLDGSIKIDDSVSAKVQGDRRANIVRNHSATHLLHKALKEVLGNHVNQAGSLVMEDRLRFDFTHFEAVSEEDLRDIEERVNKAILKSYDVNISIKSLDDAKAEGVIGLFEAKYGDEVRVVKMGDYSMELCGGTHVRNTSEIGLFKILSESGIASGVRRIEAITGLGVYNYLNEIEDTMIEVSKVLKINTKDILEKTKALNLELKSKDKEIQELNNRLAADISTDILESAQEIQGVKYISYNVGEMDMDNMRNLGDELRDKLESGVVMLASTGNSKLTFLCMITKDLNKKGLKAGDIIREVAKVTGGNGGGRPDMAQAGGKDIDKLDEALSIVPNLIEENLK